MDIRRRLHISNIVMIVVPAAIALVIGLLCIFVVWVVITGGAPFGAASLETYFGAADFSEQMEHDVKTIATLAVLVLLVAIIAAAVLTDRFMTRFVLRHITEPLGQLSTGVEQIRCGNLGYRIAYRGEDEFAPVCDAFDEMALRLSESVERDRRAEQTRKDLVMGMSHDLRSPLTSIRGYAEGLRDGVPADEAARQRYVEVILDKTGDIERKVSRLLEITKLEESGYPVNVQSLALDDYVRGYGERMGGEFAAQGMQVAYRLEPVRALADTAELDRIMGNLLDNCLKYRAGAHVEVIVHTKVAEGWAELAVSDDGPGVPSENLQRIFDPLYRGDEARGVREGSGLGLSIAAASVERMGGSVCALRSETSGLCVRMRFPMPPSEGGQGA